MKKLFLLGIVVVLNPLLSKAQELPTQKEAEQKILNNSSIIKEIEDKMGLPFSKLKMENDGWIGYKGTTFSLARTRCGEKFTYLWPSDALYTQYIIESPKDKEGVYKSMYAQVYYKRSKNTDGYCVLTNNWDFWEVSLGNPSEYGYKEFSVEEAKNLFLYYVKSGKADVLNDYIEISKIDFDRFTQSSENAGIHYLNFYFSGKSAVLTDDRSSILVVNDADRLKFNLKIERDGDKWKGTNMSILSVGGVYELDIEKAFQYGDEPDQYYASYKTHGWDAIYPQATAMDKPTGEIEQLNNRINGLFNVLKEKGAGFALSDVQDYIAPSNNDSFKAWFAKTENEKRRRSLISFDYKGVMPVKRVNKDGSFTKMAFPEVRGTFDLMDKKGKKWKKSTTRCSDCNFYSTKSLSTTHHPMVWIFENDNWYVYNPESLLIQSEEEINLTGSSDDFGF